MPAYSNKSEIVPFPAKRRWMIDFLRMGQRMHIIHTLTEVDVTKAREFIRQHKTRTGEALSFSAYITACLGQAVAEDKMMHAYFKGRKKLVLFDEVDVSIIIEREVDGEKIPLYPYVIRAANKKSFFEISREIRAAQDEGSVRSQEYEKSLSKMDWSVALPYFIRDIFWWFFRKDPYRRAKLQGTVAVTATGMFGKDGGWGIPITSYTLTLTLGGIGRKPGVVDGRIEIREYLDMTISVDHDIVDGSPLARFTRRFKELIESGYSLEVPAEAGN